VLGDAPFIPPVRRGHHECVGPGARVSYGGGQGINSATDSYWIRIRNISRRTCLLDARPEVRIRKDAPVSIRIQDNAGSWNWVPPGFPKQGVPFGLPPGREARAMIIDE